MESSIELTLDSDVAECAGNVSGSVTWSGLSKAPREVLVELVYRTTGQGNTDKGVVDQVVLPGEVSGSHEFRVQVPLDGPISYQGDLIRVHWEVRVRVDVAMQPDPKAAKPLAVLPRGGIVLWQRHRDPMEGPSA